MYIYKHRASGREQRSLGGNTSSNPQVPAPVPRPVVNGVERMCQRHGSDQTPILLFESKKHVSINSYSIACAIEEFFAVNNIKLRGGIVTIECFFLQQLIDAVYRPECIEGP